MLTQYFVIALPGLTSGLDTLWHCLVAIFGVMATKNLQHWMVQNDTHTHRQTDQEDQVTVHGDKAQHEGSHGVMHPDRCFSVETVAQLETPAE
jgi:hypothetical protein